MDTIESFRKTLGKKVVLSIVEILKMNHPDVITIEKIIGALWSLCICNCKFIMEYLYYYLYKNVDSNQQAVKDSGGISVLLNLLKSNIDNYRVKSIIFKALAAICSNNCKLLKKFLRIQF